MTIKSDQHGFEVQAARPFTSQSLVIGAASVPSTAFSTIPTMGTYSDAGIPAEVLKNNTTHVRVVATSACWIAFGAAPVAVASGVGSIYLPPGVPEYFWVLPGEKIAVIQDTAAGVLNIAELDN